MPVFNLTVPIAVKAMLQRYPPDTLRPGDVLITNDPWLCAGHLFDIAVVTPVFRDGSMVALTATVGHVGDIGGTKDSPARPRDLRRGPADPADVPGTGPGEPNEDLLTLLGRERAQARRRCWATCTPSSPPTSSARTGWSRSWTITGCTTCAHSPPWCRTGPNARCATPSARWPTGCTTRSRRTTRSAPCSATRLKLTVSGDAIELDFAGAPAAAAAGRAELHLVSYTSAHATYPLKCMLSPGVRGNAGCYRPFTVKAPLGSVLNCEKPASVNLRTRVGWYLAPNIFRALSNAAPGQVQAQTGLPHAVNIYGRDPDGAIYADHFFIGRRPGRVGARATARARCCTRHPRPTPRSS